MDKPLNNMNRKFENEQEFYYWLSAFDKIASPVYIIDAETYELLYVNGRTKNVSGEVIGSKCYKALCGRDDVCPTCTKYADFDQTGKHSISKEHYNPRTKHYYTVTECVIDWVDGRKARLEMAQIISELHELKQKQSNQASLLSIQESIIESANMMLFALDKDYKILYLNRQFKSVTKRRLRVGQRMPVDELYGDYDVWRFYEEVFPGVFSGKTYRGEVTMKDSEGNLVPIRYSSFPVRNGEGEIFAYATIGEDITKEKEEQRIRESYLQSQRFLAEFSKPFTQPNNFDDLIQNALIQLESQLGTDRIYFYDVIEDDILLTHEHLRYNDFHSTVGLVFPYEQIEDIVNELDKQPYLLFNDVREHYAKYPHFDYGAVSSLYIKLSVDGKLMGFINFLTVREMAQWTEEDCRVAVMAGSVMAGAVAFHKSELALKTAMAETQKANLAKSQFLSNVSHELRTPLNAIIGMAQIMKNSLIKNQPEAAGSMDELLIASDHLMSLVNDVLDMSKIEAGKLEIANEPFNLFRALQEVVNLIETKAQSKSVNFQTHFGISEKLNVLGDKMRLKQVLLNILGNAMKFTAAGGSVDFTVNAEILSDQRIDVKLIVRDTGIGMSDEQQAKLFQVFQQGGMSITRNYGGTGLGLAISRELVSKMGGEISVSSRLGEGSIFEVGMTFTQTNILPMEKNLELPDYKDYSGKHVLIVEDIEINRTLIIQLLSETNIVFEEAVNGQVAVEMFVASPVGYYDCIFMDIQMPVMDGLEATRQIRRLNRADAKTVVITAITANAYDENVQASLAAGMNEHISKPIDLKRLLIFFEKIFS